MVDNLCAITIVVRPLLNLSSDFWISRSVMLSKLDVASSKINIGGFLRTLLRYLFFAFVHQII